MIWVAFLFGLFVVREWPGFVKDRKHKELAVNVTMVALGLLMASLVHWHIAAQMDPLEPVKALFEPMTKWFYNIL
ncbi:hypothetical protein LLE49_05290 [Alicyclobacillus tolerans]|uniref:hypothetical protein n=1 Tax=Alicyclobacillus tolerans TaxID=90970 RepID=UPI001F244251|nr:hypothetical protein [Alicyclobacillus tolerans]MCF8564153.1 hypothetical protein [Alicyclobacillus tolerans]